MAAITSTLAGIVAKIIALVNDSYYTETIVVGIVNQLLLEIAGGFKIEDKRGGLRFTPPLPDLLQITTVSTLTSPTGGYVVAMPTTYQRNLFAVYNASGQKFKPCRTWEEFIAPNPLLNTAGAVRRCVVMGRSLYFQDIPATAETLTLHFYRYPVACSLAVTTPTPIAAVEPEGLPLHLVEPLLLNGACHRIYDQIEDGTEGNKTSTIHYGGLFDSALLTLERAIPVNGESFFLK